MQKGLSEERIIWGRTAAPHADMKNHPISSIARRPGGIKINFYVWLLGLTCVVAFTMISSFLTTRYIVNQAMRSEAERVAMHVSMMARRDFTSNVWDNLGSQLAKSAYRKILFGDMLMDIEKILALRVWSRERKVIWTSIDENPKTVPPPRILENSAAGKTSFKVDVPEFLHLQKTKAQIHSGTRILNTVVPIWRSAEKQGEAPEIVIETYSEPGFLFEQKDKIEARVRWITGLGSLVIFLSAMAVLHWFGRIQGEEKLTREFLRSVVNDAADGIIFTNHDREIVFWNPAAEALYGYTRDEALGESVLMLSLSDHKEVMKSRDHNVIVTGEAVSYETKRIRKDGSLVPVGITLSPVKDSAGKTVAVAGIHKDLSEHAESEERLRRQANIDMLTDLPNRAMALGHLSKSLALAERNGQSVALLFVDLDRFKNVNDTLGHAAGDTVLIEAANRLKSCIRKSDTLAHREEEGSSDVVARFGGDEFLVVLPDVRDASNVEVVARRILEVYLAPFVLEGQEFFLTASVGLAIYPKDGDDPHILMQNADTALYQAKESERNTYRFFNPAMNQAAIDRMQVESLLRRALQREEFSIRYQPIIDMKSGGLVGAEALLRWDSPDLGLVSPDRFLAIAEETGLIVPIGEWVMRTACHDAMTWQANGSGPIRVEVNVSSRQIMGEEFLETVTAALEETGLQADCLGLEITERLLMDDREDTIHLFEALAELGTSLSLDDFGTGYSSLNYLKKFPFRSLKIDRAFIRDVITDSGDAALCTAIAGMAKGLNLEVIGEGVESEEQLEFLRKINCDQVQGYYFSRPVSSSRFIEFQKGWSPQPYLAV